MIAFSAAAIHSVIEEFEIRFDAFAAHSFNLIRFNWPQRLGIGRGPVIQIESPKNACQTDCSTSSFQIKGLLITPMKIDLRCCGGNPAPPVNISCVHWP